jgi:hypothetical protein
MSARAERDGKMNIVLRAPFSYSRGTILTPQEMRDDATAREDTLEKELGMKWSQEIMDRLPIQERIIAIRYAYSCRWKSLFDKIAAGHPEILSLQERFHALEERCTAAVARVKGAT